MDIALPILIKLLKSQWQNKKNKGEANPSPTVKDG